MWYWEVIWTDVEGEEQVITSNRGWDTMQEAFDIVSSISDYLRLRLYDMGVVGKLDFRIVHKSEGGDGV